MIDEPTPTRPRGAAPRPDEAAEGDLDAPTADRGDDDVIEGEIIEDDPMLEAEPSAVELGLELPDDPDEMRRLLLRELMEARQEAGEYLETLQRLAADFENYRKRVERDRVENVMRASQHIVEALLPSLDNFDAALAYEPQTPAEAKILDGMRGTHVALLETLAKEGLEPIHAAGKPFDPALHEAVSAPADSGDGDLVVAQELRRGYTLRGRVVRPTMVVVDHAHDDA